MTSSQPEYTSVNVTLVLKIKSKLKINIVGQDDEHMIPKDNYRKKEIHFMTVESEVDKFGLSIIEVLRKVKDRL